MNSAVAVQCSDVISDDISVCCLHYLYASELFVLNNVPTFSANMRKLVYSLYCSLQKSDK